MNLYAGFAYWHYQKNEQSCYNVLQYYKLSTNYPSLTETAPDLNHAILGLIDID